MRRVFAIFGTVSVLLVPQISFADQSEEIRLQLNKFHLHPKQAMNESPPRWEMNGLPVTSEDSIHFSQDEIASRDFVLKKAMTRASIMQRGMSASELDEKAPIKPRDLPEDLLDGSLLVSTLSEIEAKGLTKASLEMSPWSDDYWAVYKGILGDRYADEAFPHSFDWLENFSYVEKHPVADIVAAGDPTAIDNLSPSEKYELVTGGPKLLTDFLWANGKDYYDEEGEVPSWFGICHGWAPASFMLARPKNAIEVPALNHPVKIKFYPSDIKALASLLWANAQTRSSFIGGRCNDKDPETNPNGRVTSDDCFDTNPGSWHLAIVNRIGAEKASFVMDAALDWQVWNQPVVSYEYTYFNPESEETNVALDKALVETANFTKDKFKEFRSPSTKFIVGIAMDVTYAVETRPSHRPSDSEANDAKRKVRYLYDLEIDENNKIIGGEWYSNMHPDFLWTPPAGTRAQTSYDRFLTGTWDTKTPLPKFWSIEANKAAMQGLPLATIVEQLIQAAQ